MGSAVFCRALKICAGVRAEFACSMSAATAATCGVAADVPKKLL
jgi:hypothetical protein